VSSSPGPRSRIGSRRREKKSLTGIDTEYLDRVLETFSGYLAIDELYDGPFCVISIVDNRMYQRLAYRVLEKSPTKVVVRCFLHDFAARLTSRGCHVRGITTDGSALYPQALAKVFPGVPHQVCEFHVLKEITRTILHALAQVRKQWRAKIPKQPRGRPSSSHAKAARRVKRMQQRFTDLFTNRHLFVRHHLSSSEKETLRRVTRGRPQLRTLREIMDEVYRLFDRRCRTETALDRLDHLRGRVRRFKQLGKALASLFTPNLEKALTFLDDKLLPATSNAVERSNRRYRKAQRSIYSVRTAPHIRQRIALDMQRSERTRARDQTTKTLRNDREGGGK
jgi:Transposase